MKKIIFALCSLLMFCASYAATICAKSNTYVGVLKKNISGVTSEYDNSNKVWKIDFGYKTLTGLAACNAISGTYATPTTNLYTSKVDSGVHCWCKMEPVMQYNYETGFTSYWMYLNEYADAATCASSCTSACTTAVSSNSVFRSAMFESVW